MPSYPLDRSIIDNSQWPAKDRTSHGIQQPAFESETPGDGLKEAAVLFESGTIIVRQCLLDIFFNGRRENFHTPDEDAGDLGWSRLDIQWQHRIDNPARNDDEQSGAFLEPGIA